MLTRTRTDVHRPASNGAPAPISGLRPATRAAFAISSGALAVMVVASLAGLLVTRMYPDVAWARAALRGGDMASLVLATPALAISLYAARRGSRRALLVWAGVLAYMIYDYAFYVFGARFNDIFGLHILLLVSSSASLILLLGDLDVAGIAARFSPGTPTRVIGAFLTVIALILAGLWATMVIRFAVTGELMANVPPAGQHLVFALDLTMLAPSMVTAGVLLWRRAPWGFVLGTAMSVMGALYQVNLLLAAVYQRDAGVPGVQVASPLTIGMPILYALAAITLLRSLRREG